MDWHNLAVKLRQTFGMGDKPQATNRFYQRLEREVIVKGDQVWAIIRDVWEEANGPKVRNKGHYFRFVAWTRLREFGYLQSGRARSTDQQPAALAARVAASAELPNEEPPAPRGGGGLWEELHNRRAARQQNSGPPSAGQR
jgi:hypothetical protein